ncbi:AraC family transcriptional regulator [Rhodopseudomonas sp. HC1]|uniref:AraC family transcriptional regulator n=1 Tax=Rhodopseudomonas infernalis TaxID=2897386 RepID=UPI001EE9A60E|nr:AraC family transcriptional regulator [Rhodopseudomonas infernalis]MCG6203699.1 AraC family transcriptional regulator [Rhodopseudomonas infernalis]
MVTRKPVRIEIIEPIAEHRSKRGAAGAGGVPIRTRSLSCSHRDGGEPRVARRSWAGGESHVAAILSSMMKLLDWPGRAHGFAPHFHTEFFISVTLRGVCDFECEGLQFSAGAGQISIIPPFHVHAARCGEGTLYKGVYLDGPWMRRWLPGGDDRWNGCWRAPHVIDGGELADRLTQAFAHADETAISSVASMILRNDARFVAGARSSVAWRSRAMHWMQTFAFEPCSIEKTAARMAMTGQGFARAFRRNFGVTAVFFRKQLRLHAAEELLLQHISPAMTAASSGFSDQAHLHRELKATRGVSPTNYARYYHMIG